MNRETESHFSNIPNVSIGRSRMKRPHDVKLTMNSADLVPNYVDEIIPGDTVSMDVGMVVRMSTPIFPVMDNCHIDQYFFFVPMRLIWEHWREFWGENRDTAWEASVTYEIPQIVSPSGGWSHGTIADYMGIPPLVDNISISALPFRAYAHIIQDWFRDENLKDGTLWNMDETTVTGVNTGDYVTDMQLGGLPYKAARCHSYFGSALPEPQFGPDVQIPLGSNAPVLTSDENYGVSGSDPMRFYNVSTGTELGSTTGLALNAGELTNNTDPQTAATSNYLAPSNLYADLSNASAATINQLRQAYAVQKFYEQRARGGHRYIEILKACFGVTSPDARQQRTEYLGGFRTPINISQVLQTSSTDATSPQGNAAAYSFTPDQRSVFTHSFTEHGYLIGLCVIRHDDSFQQGIERFWSRKSLLDFYQPVFAQLGEMAIKNKEIYAQGTSVDDEVFGYQEAFADYRYKPNRICAAFRSNYPGGSLDAWHYADWYTSLPILGEDWIDEDPANIARTLAVTSEHQFIADFYFDATYVRPMPIYSIPGLAGHY